MPCSTISHQQELSVTTASVLTRYDGSLFSLLYSALLAAVHEACKFCFTASGLVGAKVHANGIAC